MLRFAPGGETCDGQSRGGAPTSLFSQQERLPLVLPTFSRNGIPCFDEEDKFRRRCRSA